MIDKEFNEKKERVLEDLDKIKERIKNIVCYERTPTLYTFSGVESDIIFINHHLDKIEKYMLVYPFREKRIEKFKLIYDKQMELAKKEVERVNKLIPEWVTNKEYTNEELDKLSKKRDSLWSKHIKKPYELFDEKDKIFSWDLLEGEESGSEKK